MTRVNMRHESSGIPNLVRVRRRRLGLSQQELAYLLGHERHTQISRLESGDRTPDFVEGLMIELLLGMPGGAIFVQARNTARLVVANRLRRLKSRLLTSSPPLQRVSYKTAQLDRVLGSLRTRNAIGHGEKSQ